jgi:hypothetical protein
LRETRKQTFVSPIAVDINLEQHAWMTRGSSRRCRSGSLKPEITKIKLIDKDVDYAHRIVVGHIVLDILGQQDNLLTVFAFNESLHVAARSERVTSV